MRGIKFEYGFVGTNGIIKQVYDISEIPRISEKCNLWNELPILYLRQFTGLKDKNGEGIEVFGGDIFEAVFKDCPDGFSILGKETKVIFVKAIVVFKFGAFYVEIIDPLTKQTIYKLLSLFLQNEEKVVIGNIYENPELLS